MKMTDHSIRLVRPGVIELMGVSGPARGGWRCAAHVKSSAIDCFETNGTEITIYIGNKTHPITITIIDKETFLSSCRLIVTEMAAAKNCGQIEAVRGEVGTLQEAVEALKVSQVQLANSLEAIDMAPVHGLIGELNSRMDVFEEALEEADKKNEIYSETLDMMADEDLTEEKPVEEEKHVEEDDTYEDDELPPPAEEFLRALNTMLWTISGIAIGLIGGVAYASRDS